MGQVGDMKRKRARREEEPFQMAPMIDMVFLLLVFFMTVSTLAKDARPEVGLPESGTAVVPEAVPPRIPITVRAAADGVFAYYWGSARMEKADLGKRLRGLAGAEEATVLLRGPGDLPYRIWREVVEWCREAGVGELLFATFES